MYELRSSESRPSNETTIRKKIAFFAYAMPMLLRNQTKRQWECERSRHSKQKK